MGTDKPFQIDVLTENEKKELMSELEILAEYEGLRNFAKSETEGVISGEVWVLINSKASDNDVLKHDGSVALTSDWNTGFKITADQIRMQISRTPASATDTGSAGDICWDANYIYVCIAANTWKRSALSTW